MKRSIVSVVLLAAILALSARTVVARGEEKHAHHQFHACAKACSECMMACESCAKHCAMELAKGEKKHLHTLGTCADCGDFCALAAKVVSRRGTMSVLTCEACAKACEVCAKACEEFPEDEHMKACAKSCKACKQACIDMVKHIKEEHKEKSS